MATEAKVVHPYYRPGRPVPVPEVSQGPPTDPPSCPYNKDISKAHNPMTTRQAFILLATVLSTLGGIAAFNHYSEQAAARECVAKGYAVDQCWEGR